LRHLSGGRTRNLAVQKGYFEDGKNRVQDHEIYHIYGSPCLVLENHQEVVCTIGNELKCHGEEIELNKELRFICMIEVCKYCCGTEKEENGRLNKKRGELANPEQPESKPGKRCQDRGKSRQYQTKANQGLSRLMDL